MRVKKKTESASISLRLKKKKKTQGLTLEAGRSVVKNGGGRMKGEVLERPDERSFPPFSWDELDR